MRLPSAPLASAATVPTPQAGAPSGDSARWLASHAVAPLRPTGRSMARVRSSTRPAAPLAAMAAFPTRAHSAYHAVVSSVLVGGTAGVISASEVSSRDRIPSSASNSRSVRVGSGRPVGAWSPALASRRRSASRIEAIRR